MEPLSKKSAPESQDRQGIEYCDYNDKCSTGYVSHRNNTLGKVCEQDDENRGPQPHCIINVGVTRRSQELRKCNEMCFTDCRRPKFMIGVVRFGQVVCDLMGKDEEP